MSVLKHHLIKKIFSTKTQFSIAITGGGTSAIASLFGVSGASKTLIDATVPYHQDALAQFVSASNPPGCNTYTARAMAMTAFMKARAISQKNNVIGIGCTAAIASERSRMGTDRCHIAVQAADFTTTYDIELSKKDDRTSQESICQSAILQAMAESVNVTTRVSPEESFRKHITPVPAWASLLAGNSNSTSTAENSSIFPGAFNPLHDGHREMVNIAREILGQSVTLELSIKNVDKPSLDFLTMLERDTSEFDLVFTKAPTFCRL